MHLSVNDAARCISRPSLATREVRHDKNLSQRSAVNAILAGVAHEARIAKHTERVQAELRRLKALEPPPATPEEERENARRKRLRDRQRQRQEKESACA